MEGKRDHRPFFRTNAVLAIPNVIMVPTLDEVQQSLNKAAHLILSVSKGVAQWNKERRKGGAKANLDRGDTVVGEQPGGEGHRPGSVMSLTPSESSMPRSENTARTYGGRKVSIYNSFERHVLGLSLC